MKFRFFLGVIVFSVFATASAYAYVPPSQFLIKTLAAKHAGIKSVRVKSVVTAFEDGKATPLHFREVTIFDARSGTLTGWATDDSGQKLYEIERKSGSLTTTGVLLFDSQEAVIAKSLRELGVPVRTEADLAVMKDEDERRASEVESLGRLNGEAAWVIGGEKSARIWLQKDTFLP
jgi:hypothetical protein